MVDLDGELHTWCVYWDINGMVKMFRDGRTLFTKKYKGNFQKIPGGGTWVIGQVPDSSDSRRFLTGGAFKGELRNVNVYANFDKDHFQEVAGPALSSNTCQIKYSKDIIKSWDDFKTGFVGNYKTMIKNSTCFY
jgi:hypothetical protein